MMIGKKTREFNKIEARHERDCWEQSLSELRDAIQNTASTTQIMSSMIWAIDIWLSRQTEKYSRKYRVHRIEELLTKYRKENFQK
jgi:hypothetical protein